MGTSWPGEQQNWEPIKLNVIVDSAYAGIWTFEYDPYTAQLCFHTGLPIVQTAVLKPCCLKIKNVISLNSAELLPQEKGRLHAVKISYSHIKAVECSVVTQEHFEQIWNASDEAGTTIVYCGYGDGRTGMAIGAIQLVGGGISSDLVYWANGVQCLSQLAALNELSERIHGSESEEDPFGTFGTQPPPYTAPEKKEAIECVTIGFRKEETGFCDHRTADTEGDSGR
ncbi:hypothetical protein HOY80DRAFT_1137079 [Tuber brumale]|nr:hypothetical protein HOY80DRAFT_1137079 [Tuber brumale]